MLYFPNFFFQIISQQKQEYEAQMSIGFNKKSTAMDITKPAPVPIPINANTQVGQQPTNIVVQKKQPTSITPPPIQNCQSWTQ